MKELEDKFPYYQENDEIKIVLRQTGNQYQRSLEWLHSEKKIFVKKSFILFLLYCIVFTNPFAITSFPSPRAKLILCSQNSALPEIVEYSLSISLIRIFSSAYQQEWRIYFVIFYNNYILFSSLYIYIIIYNYILLYL